jgi:hypothetical protein
MSLIEWIAGICMAVARFGDGGQDQKLPVPSAAEQKTAEAELRSVFKEDFARKDRDAKRALARKLLSQAADEKNTPASRYMVLLLSRDLAVESLDVDTLFGSVDQLEKLYAVDKPPLAGASFTINSNALKIQALNAGRKNSMSTGDLAILGEAYLRVAEEALKDKQYDDALACAQLAEQAGRASKAAAGGGRAALLVKEIPELKKEDEQFGKSISAGTDDPGTKLVKGRYTLFVVGDESAGIDNLLGCSDEGLRNVAKLESGKPAEAEKKVDIAEAWLALAKKEENALQKRRYQQRARFWFSEAMSNAGGITQAKIEKRLKELEPQSAPNQFDLLRLLDAGKDSIKGDWKLDASGLTSPSEKFARIEIPYLPPDEYDLKVVVERKSKQGTATAGGFYFGLLHGEKQVGVEVDAGGAMTRLVYVDGKAEGVPGADFRGGLLGEGRPHTIVCKVRKTRLQVSVDDKLVIDWPADYAKVSTYRQWKSRDPLLMNIGAYDASFHVKQLSLITITGNGKPSR